MSSHQRSVVSKGRGGRGRSLQQSTFAFMKEGGGGKKRRGEGRERREGRGSAKRMFHLPLFFQMKRRENSSEKGFSDTLSFFSFVPKKREKGGISWLKRKVAGEGRGGGRPAFSHSPNAGKGGGEEGRKE